MWKPTTSPRYVHKLLCYYIPVWFSQGVTVVEDGDQYSTDLMKCIAALVEKEKLEDKGVSESLPSLISSFMCFDWQQTDVILLGGLSGRLDQTIHTLSYLHKLRKTRKRIFAVNDENVGWVLDEVWTFSALCHRYHDINSIFLGWTYHRSRPHYTGPYLWSLASWYRLYEATDYRVEMESGWA